MFGTGSTSLKENKRERNYFPTKNHSSSSIYTNAVKLEKTSKEERAKVKKHLQQLKTRENIRLGVVIFAIFSLITTFLFFL